MPNPKRAPAYSVPNRGTKGVIIALRVQTDVETTLSHRDRTCLQCQEVLLEQEFPKWKFHCKLVFMQIFFTPFQGTRSKIIIQILRALCQIHLSLGCLEV